MARRTASARSSGSHIDHVHVIVVPLDGPVEHVLAAGQPAVADHLLARPDAVGLLRVDAERIGAAAGVERGVVALGARNRDVAAVVLQHGDVGEVLHDVVRLGRGLGFARRGGGVHADVGRHAQRAGDVAQFRGVDQHAGRDALRGAVLADDAEVPAAVAAYRIGDDRSVADREPLLAGGHALEERVAHRGLEHHVAHPARHQGRVAAVMGFERRAELVPQAAAQAVAAVGGAYARRGQHAAQPVGLLDEKRAGPRAGRLDGGRRAPGAAACDHHVVVGAAAGRAENRCAERSDAARKKGSFHGALFIAVCGVRRGTSGRTGRWP